MILEDFIFDQMRFSREAFGPGRRTAGIIRHIKKELVEIEADPTDLEEWIDVVLLALDGAWRCGGPASTPHLICMALLAKLTKNKTREWPDWRALPQDAAIEHKRKPNGELITAIESFNPIGMVITNADGDGARIDQSKLSEWKANLIELARKG
jgi:hypothetical protein